MKVRTLWAVIVALAVPATGGAQIPIGSEFQVNTFTTSAQVGQTVAADANGNFVVSWTSYFQDGSQAGVYARRYLASGTPLGTEEFRVNAFTTASQRFSSVASDANGRIAFAWESIGQDGDLSGVYARRYDASGVPGPEFGVNEEVVHLQEAPRVAMDPTGRFVVVWESFNQDGHYSGIYARRYNAAGSAQAGEFRVNSYTTRNQTLPAVAIDPAGNFVVTWGSDGQDGSGYGVFGQRYNAAGVAQGDEFQVNTFTTGKQYGPQVGMDGQGGFVVVWNSDGQDGDQMGIFGQRYDASGAPLGGEFQLNTSTAAKQLTTGLSMDALGNFVVAWQSPYQDGSDYGIFVRAFRASGAPMGAEFQANTFTPGNQLYPTIATSPGGRFVVAWVSYVQDGDHFGVYARQFATDLIFDDGFE